MFHHLLVSQNDWRRNPVTCARKLNTPIITKSTSHSSRVGTTIFVLVIIMLFWRVSISLSDHKKLLFHIAYPNEANSIPIVEKETIACMACARLPIARINVSATARWARTGRKKWRAYTPEYSQERQLARPCVWGVINQVHKSTSSWMTYTTAFILLEATTISASEGGVPLVDPMSPKRAGGRAISTTPPKLTTMIHDPVRDSSLCGSVTEVLTTGNSFS